MNPKDRGTAFELEVAKLLSRWFDPSTKVDYFWRTHGSGAVSSLRQTCDSLDGDIMSIRPETSSLMKHLVIECKRRKSLDLLSFLDRRKIKKEENELLSIFREGKRKYAPKTFWLVARRDAGSSLLITDMKFDVRHISLNGEVLMYNLGDVLEKYTYDQILSLVTNS